MEQRIIFNGKSYRDVADMPPDVRAIYEKFDRFFEDANQDGVPDVLQGAGLQGLGQAFGLIGEISKFSKTGQLNQQSQLSIVKISDHGIRINGKHFRSAEEMPSEIRKIYDEVMQQAGAGEGSEPIYEESWRTRPRESYFEPHDDEDFRPASGQSTSSVMEPVNSTSTLLIIAIIGAVIICMAASAWLFFSGNIPLP